MRFGSIIAAVIILAVASSTASADSIVLSAARISPTQVALSWTGGTTLYQVYRSGVASGVVNPGDVISQTASTSSTDSSASGAILFYVVTGGHCADASTCPAPANQCQTATCTAGDCGFQNVAAGTVTSNQTIGDCQTLECDGSGNVVSVTDNSDTPNDGNACTNDVCLNGVPAFPPVSDGTGCHVGAGSRCRAGSCVPTVAVVRVGDGSGNLTGFAAPVFIEERYGDGSLVTTTPLPTTVSGANQPCTLAGTISSEGGLTRSENESFLQLGGYAATVGTATVASTSSAIVNRVVCRIDTAGLVDTSTRLNAAFDGSSIRGAASVDGTSFWVSGTSTSSTGGAWYILRGNTGGTHILTSPNNARQVAIFGGQLYGDSTSGPFTDVFTIGTGLPTTTGQAATPLPGLPTTMASPAGYVMFDLNPNIAGLDTLYVADSRTVALGGGVQKWAFSGTTWSLVATFTSGITTGPQGITGYVQPNGHVALFVTTSDGTKLLSYIDDFVTMNPTATTLATAGQDMEYRGVAMGAH